MGDPKSFDFNDHIVKPDYSNDRQCPLCRQKVILTDKLTVSESFDDRFKSPCNKCVSRNSPIDQFPCRWCTNL